VVEQTLPADAARAAIRADLALIDAAYVRLRAACTDLAGNAFRVETAERLKALDRINLPRRCLLPSCPTRTMGYAGPRPGRSLPRMPAFTGKSPGVVGFRVCC
jgi:hypothetical protein